MIEDQNTSHTISNDHIKSGLIEFAKLGLSMIYIANGSAIIAILSALPKFDTSEKCTLYLTLALFLGGIVCAIGATFCAYMTHRKLTQQKQPKSGKEYLFFYITLIFSLISLICFGAGAFSALQLIT